MGVLRVPRDLHVISRDLHVISRDLHVACAAERRSTFHHAVLCAVVMRAGFCKQQLWPLFHYVLPMSPSSAGRFNSELWQAYVKANKVRSAVLGCGWGV